MTQKMTITSTFLSVWIGILAVLALVLQNPTTVDAFQNSMKSQRALFTPTRMSLQEPPGTKLT